MTEHRLDGVVGEVVQREERRVGTVEPLPGGCAIRPLVARDDRAVRLLREGDPQMGYGVVPAIGGASHAEEGAQLEEEAIVAAGEAVCVHPGLSGGVFWKAFQHGAVEQAVDIKIAVEGEQVSKAAMLRYGNQRGICQVHRPILVFVHQGRHAIHFHMGEVEQR
jgi:hypothetical protein